MQFEPSTSTFGSVSNRFVMPVSLALLAALAVLSGFVHWTAHETERATLERERMLIESALAQRRTMALLEQHALAFGELRTSAAEAQDRDWPDANAADLLRRIDGHGRMFLVAGAGQAIYAAADGGPDTPARYRDIAAAADPLVAKVLAGLPDRPAVLKRPTLGADTSHIGDPAAASVLSRIQDRPAILTATVIPSPMLAQSAQPRPVTLLTVEPLDQEALDSIAAAGGIAGLHWTRVEDHRSADDDRLPVADFTGAKLGTLEWQPQHLSRNLTPTVAAMFALGLVIFALVLRLVQHSALQLAASQARAHHIALHDHMSRLPNRLFFHERLDQELARNSRRGGLVAVLYLDLDRFKEINDGFGHQAGDELIREVAQRIRCVLRTEDLVARLSGDEFAVLTTGVAARDDAAQLAERIRIAVGEPLMIAGNELTVGASVGVVVVADGSIERGEVMRRADIALYRAKNDGRDRIAFFEPGMDETVRRKKVLEMDLRRAIDREEIEVLYQPQVAADGERILGLEALVRWRHAELGDLPPTYFIPIAEETGLIHGLGQLVLRKACRDAVRWPNLNIAVNVSPVQFRHPGLVQSVRDILGDTGLRPSRLELEITEGVLVADTNASRQTIAALRTLGIRIALDDFGTGHSSLAYLRDFSLDKLKIDRSFIHHVENSADAAAIIHAVVALARALGLRVTAEGVESHYQHRFLRAAGCHELQGFLFSQPVAAAEIDRLLDQSPLRRAAVA